MTGQDAERPRPLPTDPAEARHHAEQLLTQQPAALAATAIGWALLAVAGELAEIRREMRRQRGR
ncbi:hypothetical protein [Streptomyces odonnellii]|uniref:hypothetical protein n=1 Tax=Streptomyces odonnellii TaxID=1417980 RepID=UPI00062641D4|nr:hypothetical protein [Streptomyces odonnellii]